METSINVAHNQVNVLNILIFRETDKESKEVNLLAVFTDEPDRVRSGEYYYTTFTEKEMHGDATLGYLLKGNDKVEISIVRDKKEYEKFVKNLQHIYFTTDPQTPVKLIVLNDLFGISYNSDVNSLEIEAPNKCSGLSITKQIVKQLKPESRTIEILPFYKVCEFIEIKYGLKEGSLSDDLDRPYNRFQYDNTELLPILSLYGDYQLVVVEEKEGWTEVSDNFKNALILLNSEYDLMDYYFDLSC